jgi:hypothetical protein
MPRCRYSFPLLPFLLRCIIPATRHNSTCYPGSLADYATLEVDLQEARNAVDNASREVESRFDFRGVEATFELNDANKTIKDGLPEDQLQRQYRKMASFPLLPFLLRCIIPATRHRKGGFGVVGQHGENSASVA